VSEYYLSGDINDLLNVELTCNDQVFFEILKMKIKSISISHSITKSREEKDLTLKREKDILNLEDIINSAPSELIQSSLNNKKNRVGNEKVEGILLRSRANWHENGEKCSQYFCKLEKKNFIKKTITEQVIIYQNNLKFSFNNTIFTKHCIQQKI
jgi:hypothetical protein